MPIFDIISLILIILVWGLNYIVLKVGLSDIPPLTLCTLRFFLTMFPAIFFCPKPNSSLILVTVYGIIMFVFQFSFLFIGIRFGMSAGLSSLLIQTNVLFTILIAHFFLHEEVNKWQCLGLVAAFIGIGLIALKTTTSISYFGFMFILAAALACGIGNIIAKKVMNENMVSLVVWSSGIAWPILLVMSFLFENPYPFFTNPATYTPTFFFTILYVAFPTTLFAFSAWSQLLNHHPAGKIAPYSLLIPIISSIAGYFILDETFPAWKIAAMLLVFIGLSLNLLGTLQLNSNPFPRIFLRRRV